MNKNRMHMVPQIVIDCAENLVNAKSDHTRIAYETRLLAIKEYCDYMLKQSSNKTSDMFNTKRNRK